ncbi:L-amino acid N-acyltransferase YncA [Haloechinothrix alba]|uniref:L-amino acid N-acyltransferase YncA n=1 Tax=Haloechinothrix alba TaxID=664784 RepID=A0A238ZQF6_9PSEU|nr:GNAT family N-acetyltransferase [Haloechinothrix alba]SNR85271.1 L-amino acid N-acyltransferase YncA [Haloechinothrix alba]
MRELEAAQAEHFARTDPLLPRTVSLPEGTCITAGLPGGGDVRGNAYRAVHGPLSMESLWHTRVTWELSPLIGDSGAAGMHAVLAAYARWLGPMPEDQPRGETTVLLGWPSRDVAASAVLRRHGFTAGTVLAVRHAEGAGEVRAGSAADAPAGPGSPLVTVRHASVTDIDALIALELTELRYSRAVLGQQMRTEAAELVGAALRGTLDAGEPVFVAEDAGQVVGMTRAGWSSPETNTSIAHRLPAGTWARVDTLSVAPEARGCGVGQRLMSVAHAELVTAGVRGSYLYYDTANPLSSVFWPKQGYRPLWTLWTTSPDILFATAE